MRYNGKTPAIFTTTRRTYLVQPGGTVRKGSRLVLTHSNLGFLAWAYDKSTYGLRDGSREPGNNPKNGFEEHRSYEAHATAVLLRVLKGHDACPQEITGEMFDTMRHALGSSHLDLTHPSLGWRNYYAGETPEVTALVDLGFMEGNGQGVFRVTKAGLEVCGVDEETIESLTTCATMTGVR